MRQLNDEPKPVYKVGFIRKKGKATATAYSGAQKLVACCLGEGWGFYGHLSPELGGFFYWPCICMWAVLDELVCLPLIMGGNNIESILFIRTVADL
jgi:hypothetical protein